MSVQLLWLNSSIVGTHAVRRGNRTAQLNRVMHEQQIVALVRPYVVDVPAIAVTKLLTRREFPLMW